MIEMNNVCDKLHKTIRALPRHYFPFTKDQIYKNGIYILFEMDELAHNGERIVRIGTHRGDGNLYNRLKEHFINENKDRSIFRKNIGRAILNKNNDEYIELWEIDLQEIKNRKIYGHRLNIEKQNEIEKYISAYIQSNLSFAVIEVQDKNQRLYFESKLISTVSRCDVCHASKEWLGNYSPKDKIVESGLWLVNELYKEPFTEEELEKFIKEYVGD
jgi:hypothetical protein